MSNTNFCTTFTNMDLGTGKPISVPMETIEVQVSVSDLVGDYAKAFVKEVWRVNPLRAEQVKLTEEEVLEYCNYLLTKRIEVVNDSCYDFRKLKNLYIPSYVQYVLSMIGRLVARQYGITMMPVMEETSAMTFEEAIIISDKIGAFENDLQIVIDAMPRTIDGNPDVMSTALIAGYVRSLKVLEHPSATYVTAFLDMKLKQETAFQALYRVQYDDIEFIATALTRAKGLY